MTDYEKPKPASAKAMLDSNFRANAANRANGYFYGGNLGDSIERRYNGGFEGSLLGNGNDLFQGTLGTGQTWLAQGPGNYYGTGLLNGVGRMFSGAHGVTGGGFQYLHRFSGNSSFSHQIIAQCLLAYLGYGVVRNIVDLYADFATEGISLHHKDKTVRNFYRTWAKKVKLKERVHNIFLNLFVSGNCFVHRSFAKIEPKDKIAMQRAVAFDSLNGNILVRGEEEDFEIQGKNPDYLNWYLSKSESTSGSRTKPKTFSQETVEPEDNIIPWGYTMLNPLQMEIRGSKIRGEHYWAMCIDKKDTLSLTKSITRTGMKELGSSAINIPAEFKKRIKEYNGMKSSFHAEIELNNRELSVLQAPGKFDWFDWAVPFIFPSLRALSFKDCLRNMELRACQSVINSIFLFKLGKQKEGMPAEEEHFERLADMLQQPGQSMHILWNEEIEAEVVQADTKGLFGADKYESADKDILTSLGVPEVLIGGKGGSFSNSFLSVAATMERLESYREVVLQWILGECKIIADAMGFRKLPEVSFNNTNLKDEKSFNNFMLALYDRNVISGDTLLESTTNTSSEIEVSKLKDEKQTREKSVFEERGPFIREAKQQKAQTGVNGRPINSETGPTGKQENPRGPQGQASVQMFEKYERLSAKGRAMLDALEEFCNERVLRLKRTQGNTQIKHIKQLRQQEKDRLEQLIYNVFSHMPEPQSDEISDDFITNILNSDAANGVKADVLELYTNKIADYSKVSGKAPTREMRRQFIVSAWTQRAMLSSF